MSDYLTSEQSTKGAQRYLPPDVTWIDSGDGYQRAIVFEPGYNDTVPRRYGKHGMAIRFLLRGSKGITQFLMNTGWTPGEPVGILNGAAESWAPTGYDVGYHALVRQYDSAAAYDCDYMESGKCFYDGSGLAADELLAVFIREGEPAVWRKLKEHHDELLGPDDRDPAADDAYDRRVRLAKRLRERADEIEYSS